MSIAYKRFRECLRGKYFRGLFLYATEFDDFCTGVDLQNERRLLRSYLRKLTAAGYVEQRSNSVFKVVKPVSTNLSDDKLEFECKVAKAIKRHANKSI